MNETQLLQTILSNQETILGKLNTLLKGESPGEGLKSASTGKSTPIPINKMYLRSCLEDLPSGEATEWIRSFMYSVVQYQYDTITPKQRDVLVSELPKYGYDPTKLLS